MSQVTMSSKYQVVIPRAERERARLRPGQKFAVLVKHGVVKLIPIPTLEEMRGFARGADLGGIAKRKTRYDGGRLLRLD